MLIGSSSFALAMSAHLPTRITTTIQPGRWRRRMLLERGEDSLLGEYGGWLHQSMRPAAGNIKGRWYAVNTRDPTRDETLREGLVRLGAVIERTANDISPPSLCPGGALRRVAPNQGMRDQEIGRAELACRLGWHLPQVDRVLDVRHRSTPWMLRRTGHGQAGSLRWMSLCPKSTTKPTASRRP